MYRSESLIEILLVFVNMFHVDFAIVRYNKKNHVAFTLDFTRNERFICLSVIYIIPDTTEQVV